MYVFREGVRGAIEHRVVDEAFQTPAGELTEISLPEEFLIYSYTCGCPYRTELICSSSNGMWQKSGLLTGTKKDREKHWELPSTEWGRYANWLRRGDAKRRKSSENS